MKDFFIISDEQEFYSSVTENAGSPVHGPGSRLYFKFIGKLVEIPIPWPHPRPSEAESVVLVFEFFHLRMCIRNPPSNGELLAVCVFFNEHCSLLERL